MDISKTIKFAKSFEKAAQGCILEPGQSTMSKNDAQRVAEGVLSALKAVDPALLANYEYSNLVAAMEDVLENGKITNQSVYQAALQEVGPAGVGAFSNIQPFVQDVKRMNCISW